MNNVQPGADRTECGDVLRRYRVRECGNPTPVGAYRNNPDFLIGRLKMSMERPGLRQMPEHMSGRNFMRYSGASTILRENPRLSNPRRWPISYIRAFRQAGGQAR
jgi:hypothetical protein